MNHFFTACALSILGLSSKVPLICCQKHESWPYETDRIRERGEERERKKLGTN